MIALDSLETAYIDDVECRALGERGGDLPSFGTNYGGQELPEPLHEPVWTGWGLVFGQDAVDSSQEWQAQEAPVQYHGYLLEMANPRPVTGRIHIYQVISEQLNGRIQGRIYFLGTDEPRKGGPPGIIQAK